MRRPRSARAMSSARCWARPPGGASEGTLSSGSPEAANRPGPDSRSYRCGSADTGPRTSGPTLAGARARRAACSAGARMSQRTTCSTKSAGSPRLSVSSESPPSRRRAARGGSATALRRTISRASAKVVGSAAKGPLDTAAAPPCGTSTRTRARARRIPAACSARASPPPLRRDRCARTQFISSMGAPLRTSASFMARTSSSVSGGRGASASADPPPDTRRSAASSARSDAAAESSASPARSDPSSGSGCPPSISTPPPAPAGTAKASASSAFPSEARAPASISGAAFPRPSVTSRPPGAGRGAAPDAQASRTRRSAESASTTARNSATSWPRRSIAL